MCQSLMGAQIAAAAAAAAARRIYVCTVFFPSIRDLSSLGVWQVSAAEDEVNRFNPDNVFSTLKTGGVYLTTNINKFCRLRLLAGRGLQSETTLSFSLFFFDRVTQQHGTLNIDIFLLRQVLFWFFFSFVKMLVWTNTKYAWSYEKHPLHYTKEKNVTWVQREI